MRNRIGDPPRLAHIVKAADQLAGFLTGFSYDQFLHDELTIFTAVRAVEIIGEASRPISDELKDAYPKVA